jgi:hypothetical protein
MSKKIRILGVICAVAALGGCMERDPYRRTDVWRPTGANSANLAAMVADPNDLIRGRGTTRAGSGPSVIAVERVSIDRPKPLLGTSGGAPGAASGAGGGQGGGQGGDQGAGAGAGGAPAGG